jgi:hypothetical protein
MIDNWTRDDSDTTSTGVSYFKINFAAATGVPTRFDLRKPTPVIPGKRVRKAGKGPRHTRSKR